MSEPVDRAGQAVEAARVLLEQAGREAMSMRRAAERIGIRAPSLYKHVPDKAELELRLVAHGLEEVAAALAAGGPDPARLASAYRAWAVAHAGLYALMTAEPLPRDRLPPGLEAAAADPLLSAFGDEHVARAVWASAHGLVTLELAGRFPPEADLDAAWAAMVAAYASFAR